MLGCHVAVAVRDLPSWRRMQSCLLSNRMTVTSLCSTSRLHWHEDTDTLQRRLGRCLRRTCALRSAHPTHPPEQAVGQSGQTCLGQNLPPWRYDSALNRAAIDAPIEPVLHLPCGAGGSGQNHNRGIRSESDLNLIPNEPTCGSGAWWQRHRGTRWLRRLCPRSPWLADGCGRARQRSARPPSGAAAR